MYLYLMEQEKQPTNTVKNQLYDLLISISWGDLSRRYFGQSGAWLYNKLDGKDRDNNPTPFTEEEKEQLRGALYDLAFRIRKAADNME